MIESIREFADYIEFEWFVCRYQHDLKYLF